MQTLLIDNYDSFSHILFQYLWELNGTRPIFIHNDAWTLAAVRAARFDNIVISPGPGHPGRRRDFGICSEVLAAFPDTPLLGVCLGHQGMGLHLGARVIAAPEVRHGKASRIRHDGTGLFAGLPPDFSAVRYHSLVLDAAALPPSIAVTARSLDDDQIMAIAAPGRPWFGVQFHPESIGSEHGKTLLANFRELTAQHAMKKASLGRASMPPIGGPHFASKKNPASVPPPLRLPWRDPENVFAALFSECPAAFWLDSAAAPAFGTGLDAEPDAAGEPIDAAPRFTYMGAGRRLFETRGASLAVLEIPVGGSAFARADGGSGDPLDWLQGHLRNTVSLTLPRGGIDRGGYRGGFRGGLVGYLGYGLKRFTGSGWTEGAPASDWPDALFLDPDRILAFDHGNGEVWAWAPQAAGEAWLAQLAARWENLAEAPLALRREGPEGDAAGLRLPWKPALEKPEYLARIRNLQVNIRAGESYEACLTNSLECPADADPFLVYRLLRRTNPAPYAAYLKFPQGAVLSASPECFLKSDAEGRLASRPIKGTRPRGRNAEEDRALRLDLARHPKDHSENLMIVDLVRNDFGRVCAVGSVAVPDSMRVEAHPTVFQLVSTVSGRLAEGESALSAVRACFPGGSMTGAPKLRTMELLEAAEGRARGIFSGALGYLGADGAMDLGMVIRSLVHAQGRYSIGCGGAILAESDPEQEFSEAMLKAFAPMRAVELALRGSCGGWRFDLAQPSTGSPE